MELLSTTKIAKEINQTSSELFLDFESLGLIFKENGKWFLTELGKQKGGQMRSSQQYGEFIVWPKSICIEIQKPEMRTKTINGTAIGEHFNISGRRINLILSELGWVEKEVSGWKVTKAGKEMGGKQREHDISGVLYVHWPKEILQNKRLIEVCINPMEAIKEMPERIEIPAPNKEINSNFNIKEKYPPTFKTKDGHMVRSRGEVMIDNFLYEYNLTHSYEKQLAIEENVFCDFYLRNSQVYIEYWGFDNDEDYNNRKKKKLEIYKKYEFPLLEITNEDLKNLDDVLPKKLLKFGIKVY